MVISDKISEHTRVKRIDKILQSEIDGEVIMLLPDMNEYMGMNNTGSAIWKLLKDEISVEDIVRELLIEFEIDKDTCRNEVINYLKILLGKGLIEISS